MFYAWSCPYLVFELVDDDFDFLIIHCSGTIRFVKVRVMMREYGTLGLAQTIKQLRDSGMRFPIYEEDNLSQGSFKNLGAIRYYRNLDIAAKNPQGA